MQQLGTCIMPLCHCGVPAPVLIQPPTYLRGSRMVVKRCRSAGMRVARTSWRLRFASELPCTNSYSFMQLYDIPTALHMSSLLNHRDIIIAFQQSFKPRVRSSKTAQRSATRQCWICQPSAFTILVKQTIKSPYGAAATLTGAPHAPHLQTVYSSSFFRADPPDFPPGDHQVWMSCTSLTGQDL